VSDFENTLPAVAVNPDPRIRRADLEDAVLTRLHEAAPHGVIVLGPREEPPDADNAQDTHPPRDRWWRLAPVTPVAMGRVAGIGDRHQQRVAVTVTCGVSTRLAEIQPNLLSDDADAVAAALEGLTATVNHTTIVLQEAEPEPRSGGRHAGHMVMAVVATGVAQAG